MSTGRGISNGAVMAGQEGKTQKVFKPQIMGLSELRLHSEILSLKKGWGREQRKEKSK
jgi:hypothetical protein